MYKLLNQLLLFIENNMFISHFKYGILNKHIKTL